MTTVIVYKNQSGSYKGFTCIGHAGYGKKRLFHNEPDILCSAISTLVINTVNCLEELSGEKIKVNTLEETGFIKCDLPDDLQEKSVFLIDSMIYGLQNISKEYGEMYLLVKFEEV